jgi:phenylpropionate dioxygenase-like ring-hydroxylating dioxygenase large terminal subunit
MDDQNAALMYAAVERETQRTTYPETFPVLPEVPAGRYFEPSFYDLELQHVWRKTWLSAAHISELPKPGSYKLFEKLGLSIIISRGLEGEVRAFHNSCRHRGSALLLEEKGAARRFVCPYHAWGYGLDGRLVSVPEAHDFACLDKAERPLRQVRCETWRGFIFINLDDAAEPLADFLAPTARQVADFPLDDMVVKDILTAEMDCNWKAAYDNFLEIYHVNTVHAKSLAPYFDPKSFSVSLLKNGHARFATRKRTGNTFFSDGVDQPDDFTTRFKDHTIALPFFPNGFTALDPVGFTWQLFWPAGPGKSIMQAVMMGWKKDDEEDRKFWAQMRLNQIAVLAEDLHLFAGVQRSLESGAVKTILMGYQERALYWYHEEIDRRIGAENIPEQLRVTQVLAGQAAD